MAMIPTRGKNVITVSINIVEKFSYSSAYVTA